MDPKCGQFGLNEQCYIVFVNFTENFSDLAWEKYHVWNTKLFYYKLHRHLKKSLLTLDIYRIFFWKHRICRFVNSVPFLYWFFVHFPSMFIYFETPWLLLNRNVNLLNKFGNLVKIFISIISVRPRHLQEHTIQE